MFNKRGVLSPFFGKCRSEETKQKIGLANKGKRLGFKHSNETKNKISVGNNFKKIKVLCVETGNLYGSINECAAKMQLRQGKISLVVNGKRKKTGGYTFKKVF